MVSKYKSFGGRGTRLGSNAGLTCWMTFRAKGESGKILAGTRRTGKVEGNREPGKGGLGKLKEYLPMCRLKTRGATQLGAGALKALW
jgi:hypothetical protein